MSIINRYSLKVSFDEVELAKALGGCHFLPNNEQLKEELKILLNPLLELLNNKKGVSELFITETNNKLRLLTSLKVSMDNLINKGMTIGGPTLNELLSYILRINNNIINEDEKLEIVYIINIVNLEALRKKEGLVNNATTNNRAMSLSKYNFEIEYANELEEIIKLVDLYQKLLAKMNETERNQIVSLRSDKSLNIEILNDEVQKGLKKRIEDMGASFTVDEYIRISYLKEIFDWYNIYNSTSEDSEYQEVFFKYLMEAVLKYQSYSESVIDEQGPVREDTNNILFLPDKPGIVGINWVNKDGYEYNSSDVSAIFRGLKLIKTSDRNYLLEETEKSKGAGIPGVGEEKFRRLKRSNIRIIFMDLNNLVYKDYMKYISKDFKCYLVINFGKKLDKHEIYDSIISSKSSRIPNLIIEYQQNINNGIKQIIDLPISEEEKETRVKSFLFEMIDANNKFFNSEIQNLKGYNKLNDNTNTNDGGLKNA